MSTFTVLESYVTLRRQVALLRALESASVEFGHNQIGVLYQLSQGSTTAKELAEYASIDKASMSRTLTLLEKSGLIKRIADSKDRRVVNIHLTAKGRAQADKAIRIRDNVGKALDMGLTQAERLQFSALVDKIVHQLKEG